jgi:hypothetical protein
VSPGDGTCADEYGRCSLEGAIVEANEAGEATIVVPEYAFGTRVLPAITGRVEIQPSSGGINFAGGEIEVAVGGHLELTGIGGEAEVGGVALRVHGTAEVRSSALMILEVGPTGRAVLTRSLVRDDPDWAGRPNRFTNDGTVLLWFSTVWTTPISTGPSATTAATSSLIMSPCATGSLTSGGYNAGNTDACGLDAATDLQGEAWELGLEMLEGAIDPFVYDDSPIRDHIPDGAAGCGLSTAIAPTPRVEAFDDDDDGTVGCEPGRVQLRGPR